MTVLLAVLCGVLGLAVGSFLNVVIWRVPRGESVVRPASRCPGCSSEIAPRDNVPVLSWLLLHARCRGCGARISARYPLVELATGALFAGMAVRLSDAHHGWALLPAFLYLAAIGVALTAIDLDTQKLPNRIVLPSYPVLLALVAVPSLLVGDAAALVRGLLAGAVLYAAYFVLCFATAGRGLGFGDVKLAGLLGFGLGWLGWPSVLVGVLAAHLVGGLVVIGLVLVAGAGRKTRVPFGPMLIAGALVGIFAGVPLGSAYLSLSA